MKKVLSIILALVLAFGCTSVAFAADVSRIDEYKAKFYDGVGPEVNGIATDYVAYTPDNFTEGVKYPLVVFFHGMGEGAYPGAQIAKDNLPLWASEELQSRFIGTQGSYIIALRSHEEDDLYWPDEAVESAKAAIDQFIASNSDSIDLSRIYVGGFSMGGKMTLKMLISYPTFFAAAFPMCPAYVPTDAELEAIADIPIWLIVSKYDVIAGWYTFSQDTWTRFKKITHVPEQCRLSLFGLVDYPDGKKTTSNHHVWFAQANDLFMYNGGDYYNMTTTDAKDNEIKLEYPNGLINWLSSFNSSYNGEPLEPTGLIQQNDSGNLLYMAKRIINALTHIIFDAFTFQIQC